MIAVVVLPAEPVWLPLVPRHPAQNFYLTAILAAFIITETHQSASCRPTDGKNLNQSNDVLIVDIIMADV